MSRHKFKAWDNKEGCWLFDGNSMDLQYSGESGAMMFDNDAYTGMNDSLTWVQFTGLLDKNGKDIYEGDIVIKDEYIWRDNGKPNYNGTVEWIYSQWQVVAHCINSEKRGISDGINQGLNYEGVEEGEKSDWEIIGNIFESPELLAD